MTLLNRSDKETLKAVRDMLDDNLDAVSSREAKTLLSGCKDAVSELLRRSNAVDPSRPLYVAANDGPVSG